MATKRQHSMRWVRECPVAYRCLLALCIFLLSSSSQAFADSRYELAPAGTSKIGRLGFQLKWQAQWGYSNNSYLDGYWNPTTTRGLASSQSNLPAFAPSTSTLGLAAVLRYQRNDDGTGFYAEAGTGPRYQSGPYDLAGRSQNSQLAFNALAGVGFVWKNGLDLGFKAVHVTRGQGKDGTEPGSMVGIDLKYHW